MDTHKEENARKDNLLLFCIIQLYWFLGNATLNTIFIILGDWEPSKIIFGTRVDLNIQFEST